jgi:predicted double-glycine peptidase
MEHNLLPVQPFQETLNAGMCGPASLKMVLAYYDVVASEAELAIKTNCIKEIGTTAHDLVRVAAEYGIFGEIRNESSLTDIAACVAQQKPVIVDWFTRGRDDYPPEIAVPDGHYSVVVGIDETYIYLQDPEIGGLRTLTRDAFYRAWFDFSGEQIKPDELIIRQLIVFSRS